MKENILKLEHLLKIKFSNKALLIKAMTHKSFDSKFNNERLEFLGDRVIALILSKKLLELYPNENEGVLDKRFARLVNRNTCASIANKIGLKKFVILGNAHQQIKKKDEKILSDVCESLIGSVYLEKGFEYASKFVLKLWHEELKNSDVTIVDPKTKLQEYSLKLYKQLPKYKLEKTSGPKHLPIFKISVEITGTKKLSGEGNSKKDAQQNAAANLLKKINIQ